MSLFILLLLFLLLLFGRPRLVWSLPLDGACMTHDRTNLINAFFIVIIVLRHISQQIVPYSGIDAWYGLYFDNRCGQAIVSPFFFFSGYGIYKSILRKREAYVRELISRRFIRLYINTGICGVVLCMVYMMTHLTPEEAVVYFFETMLFGGNQYWFIMMTLAVYVIVWLAFKVCGASRPVRAVMFTFLLVYLFCAGMLAFKPVWWLDSALCFPCGMLMGEYQTSVENWVRKLRLPIMLVGVILVVIGWKLMLWMQIGFAFISKLDIYGVCNAFWANQLAWVYHILAFPLCTVVWIIGILWFFAGIQWQKIPAFIVWLGGPAVFYIFVLHFIPIRIIQAGNFSGPYPVLSRASLYHVETLPTGWGVKYPEVSIVATIVVSLVLAYMACLLIPRVNNLIFKSRK